MQQNFKKNFLKILKEIKKIHNKYGYLRFAQIVVGIGNKNKEGNLYYVSDEEILENLKNMIDLKD